MINHAGMSVDAKIQAQNRIADKPIIGRFSGSLSPKVRSYVEECVKLCQPDDVYICDGSDAECAQLLELLERQGTIERLPKYKNW